MSIEEFAKKIGLQTKIEKSNVGRPKKTKTPNTPLPTKAELEPLFKKFFKKEVSKRGPKPKEYSQKSIIKSMLNTGNWFTEMELTKATVPNIEERYGEGHRAARGYINKLREGGMLIISRETTNPYTNNPTTEYGLTKDPYEFIRWEKSNVNYNIKKGRRKNND